MSDGKAPISVRFEAAEDGATNASANTTLGDIVALRLSRRGLMQGALAIAAVEATAIPPVLLGDIAARAAEGLSTTSSFAFAELAAGSDLHHHVAEGYEADVLIRWGDAVLPGALPFDPMNQTAEAQSRQFGYNNDFLGFIPLDASSARALLVVNHEYTNEELMFPALGRQDQERDFAGMTADLIAIEMAAHGGSVLEIERKDGKWRVVPGSKYARRITASTRMRISGPAAGHARMRTSADPNGTTVLGMLNNCGGAVTPWGTWLSCEENINGYFWNKAAAKTHPDAKALQRYGVPGQWFAWGKVDPRFDVEKEPNEPNRFGWVVEIDPFDPASAPVKRTALGRFKHEGAGNIVNGDGRFVVYQGDDQAYDYVYKFVTEGKVDSANRAANRDLLDRGTLYVARFDADGTGEWLPLVHGTGPLSAENGFNDQGDVVIHARLAADELGATKMDRPEDIDVNPKTGKVYLALTSNAARKADEIDNANPRHKNRYGHIVEFTPAGGDHAAPRFAWEILVKCGDPDAATVGARFNPATSKDGWFANPDNCAVDALGRLWIAADGNSASRTGRADGIWAMETEGAARGTSKLFFRVPVGAEMCGPCPTPDLETFFVAVQHPGEAEDDDKSALGTFESPTTRWPDFDERIPPRPSVVAITRKGGGKIGV